MRYDLGGELFTEITYHGDVSEPNVQWTQSFDPATRLPRPFNIGATGLAGSASSVMLEVHIYDGVGNVRQIGILEFDYDRLGRFQSESDDGGNSLRQRALYDSYGNLKTLVVLAADKGGDGGRALRRTEHAIEPGLKSRQAGRAIPDIQRARQADVFVQSDNGKLWSEDETGGGMSLSGPVTDPPTLWQR